MKTIALILCLAASAAHAQFPGHSPRIFIPPPSINLASFAAGNATIGPSLPANPDGTITNTGGVWYDGSFSATAAGRWAASPQTSTNYVLSGDGSNGVLNGKVQSLMAANGTAQLTCTVGNCTIAGSLAVNGSVSSVLMGTNSNITGGANTIINLGNGTAKLTANTTIWSVVAPTISLFGGTGAAMEFNNGTGVFQINVGTVSPGSTGKITLPAVTNRWGCDCYNATTTSAVNHIVVTASDTVSCNIGQVAVATGLGANFAASDRVVCFAFGL